MIQRKKLVIANWKMHFNVSQASSLVAQLHKNIQGHRDIEVVLAPPMLSLQPIAQQIDHRRFRLAVQNAYHKDEGGFTGEVSFAMVREIADYAIIGHSERRIYFGETNDDVRDKVAASIRNGIKPVVCIGETSTERSDGQTKQVIHDQLVTALANVTSEDLNYVSIAYEPVWAISTFGGEKPDPDKIEKIFDYIRLQIAELYGEKAANNVRILYGGSVDDQNAWSLININGCEGFLIGSASLNYHKFTSIIESVYKFNRTKDNG